MRQDPADLAAPLDAAETQVAALRLQLLAVQKNVSVAEMDAAAVARNTTNATIAFDHNYGNVQRNAARLDSASLLFSTVSATVNNNNQQGNVTTNLTDALVVTAGELAAKAAGDAQPQNITRVETLETKLWDATDPTNAHSIDNFKIELIKDEEALMRFRNGTHERVHELLHSTPIARQVKKLVKSLEKLHERYIDSRD